MRRTEALWRTLPLVPAGTNGDINLYTTDPTHVIVDVNGNFAP
ncbi:MAG TPA: hypothetical protein VE621_02460 [Bryobacteraceae bacterium]|nr:hypothetical protein [Bryobacteraceae bacterium]